MMDERGDGVLSATGGPRGGGGGTGYVPREEYPEADPS